MKEEKLWKIDITMMNILLRIVVTDNDLKGLTSETEPYEDKVFEYVIKGKGVNPLNLTSINIESIPLINEGV